MNNEQLLNELDSDLKIDTKQLGNEAANNPILYSKWLRYYGQVKKDYVKASLKVSRTRKERLDWINGRTDELCEYAYEKSEIKTVIDGDREYQKAVGEMEIIGIKLDTCKNALDAIKNRGFSIKHAIDMRMLESGK